MSDALHGYGTEFQSGDGASPEVFTAQGEIISITPPGEETESIDITHLKSTGKRREYIAGMIEPGEVSLEINYLPNSTFLDDLRASQDAGTIDNYRIVFPDAGDNHVQFAAFVTKIAPEVPLDNKISASVTFKVTGESTWTSLP